MKSYLAEILGLEEDEVFQVPWSTLDFRISGGSRECWNDGEHRWENCWNEYELQKLINNRDKIIKTKHLTEQEKKICDDCGAKWISRDDGIYVVELWKEKPEMQSGVIKPTFVSGTDSWIADVNSDLFPSVKPGDCIEVR